jgi:BirA family biotin operon repressor/biotin-[acetyl-CoA-carboxylase] ligase
MNPGPLSQNRIQEGLNCRRIASVVEVVDSTTSTNDLAWQRVEEGVTDGFVVLAEHQTDGRGRFGRTWASPRGAGVLASAVVRDHTDALSGPMLGLIGAIAARDAIRSASAVHADIRWPNDVMIAGRKVGGILIESRAGQNAGRVFVVGVGINCLQHAAHFPPDLKRTATSLDLQSAEPIDRHAVCRALLHELDRWLSDPHRFAPEIVRQAWLDRAVGIGRAVRLRHAGREYTGVVVDLDPTAALVVQLDRGARRAFDAETTTILEG